MQVSYRQAGRCYLIVDLVEGRKATLFCYDFWIRASFGHYYGEYRFSKAFLHIITGIMLFQLDSSRNTHKICSSNTSNTSNTSNKSNTTNTPQVRVLIISPPKDLRQQISASEVASRWRCSHNEDVLPTPTSRQTGVSSGHQTRSCPLRFSLLRYTGHYRYKKQPPLSHALE